MIYLIVSVLFYSFNNLLWKKALQKSNFWFIMALRALMTTGTGFVIMLFYFPNVFSEINYNAIVRVAIASILGALGLVFMISALQRGTLRLLGVFNIVSVVFSVTYLLFFEKIDLLRYLLGTSLIILGFIFYIFQLKKTPSDETSFKVILNYTLMSLFFAASGIVHWTNLKQSIPPIFSLVNQELVVFLVGSVGFYFQPKVTTIELTKMFVNTYKIVIVMALLIISAVWTGFLGLKITNPFISSLIALCTPVLTICLGSIFFKEKWNYKISIALFFLIIGAFLLHLDLNNL